MCTAISVELNLQVIVNFERRRIILGGNVGCNFSDSNLTLLRQPLALNNRKVTANKWTFSRNKNALARVSRCKNWTLELASHSSISEVSCLITWDSKAFTQSLHQRALFQRQQEPPPLRLVVVVRRLMRHRHRLGRPRTNHTIRRFSCSHRPWCTRSRAC